MIYDTIIIGGGAAGLFCAIHAGRRGRRVLVIEHAEKVGKKILISGGGRCNFTNLYTRPENFISRNPNFHKSALARYTPDEFVSLVQKHRIRYHEKKLGQLFCDNSSTEIVEMLLRECAEAGVQINIHTEVKSVSKSDRFMVETTGGRIEGETLVIATGGLSIPKIGATDFGHRVARQFGLRITQLKPALVPFTMSEPDRKAFSQLAGISVDAQVTFQSQSFRENILVTHQGLSGPAILQISSYWEPGEAVRIDLLPDIDAMEWLKGEHQSARELKTLLSQHWPNRFAAAWTQATVPSKPLCQYSNRELARIADQIDRWEITPSGTEGYRKAEVTAGGVETGELSSKTMEAHKVPGLFFIGEVVDVTGHLGGFNFQWAWASGYAAGQVA